MKERQEEVADLQNKYDELENGLGTVSDDIAYEQTQQQMKVLNKEIEKRANGNEIFDYYLNAGELLYQYYDVQDTMLRARQDLQVWT